MTLHPRFVQSLLGVACACATLAASPLANSQSAPPVQQEQPPRAVVGPPTSDSATGGELRWGSLHVYEFLIDSIGNDEAHVQQEIREGKEPTHIRLDLVKIIGFREDEQQATRTILLDAFLRLQELNKQFMAAGRELHQNPGPESKAKWDAMAQQGPKIMQETIDKLRQELGKEAFQKLDAYANRQFGGVIKGPTPPRHSTQEPQQPQDTPNPEQPHGAQP
jgi:hypothetical protein